MEEDYNDDETDRQGRACVDWTKETYLDSNRGTQYKKETRASNTWSNCFAKYDPAGMKNSRSEDFLLAKHTSHKHPHHHHDVLFSRLAAWFP